MWRWQMGKQTQLARLEALEAKRDHDDGFQIVGRYERNRDGSLTVYSDVSRCYLDGDPPIEKIVERVPRERAAHWLKNLIRIERSYGKPNDGDA